MTFRTLARTCITVALLALLLGSALPVSASPAVVQPTHSVGDWWYFVMTETTFSSASTDSFVETIHTSTLDDSLGQELLRQERTTTHFSGTDEVFTINSTLWLDPATMGTVRHEGTNNVDQTFLFEITDAIGGLHYPLRVGDSWEGSMVSIATSIEPPSSEKNIQVFDYAVDVLRREEVTVPAGTFDSLVLRTSYGNNTTTRWYSPAANNIVQIEYVNTDADAPYRYVDALVDYEVAAPGAFEALADCDDPTALPVVDEEDVADGQPADDGPVEWFPSERPEGAPSKLRVTDSSPFHLLVSTIGAFGTLLLWMGWQRRRRGL